MSSSTSAERSPSVAPAAGQRDILSSLQQMNLQSRPFDFAQDAQAEVAQPFSEQTPEPFSASNSSQKDTPETAHEPFSAGAQPQVRRQ